MGGDRAVLDLRRHQGRCGLQIANRRFRQASIRLRSTQGSTDVPGTGGAAWSASVPQRGPRNLRGAHVAEIDLDEGRRRLVRGGVGDGQLRDGRVH